MLKVNIERVREVSSLNVVELGLIDGDGISFDYKEGSLRVAGYITVKEYNTYFILKKKDL